MKLLLATRNAHKVREISEMLRGSSIEVETLESFPDLPEVAEDRPTIEGNALKKAQETARAAGLWTLADDTGLEVEALSGSPGVFSARYAGPACDYAANNRKLLDELSGLPRRLRRAVLRTVMALAGPAGETTIEEGRLEGFIADKPLGENGFGYDPVFFVAEAGLTLAQMTAAHKNAVSHRFRALARMLPHVRKLALGLAALLLCALPAHSGRTEPGQETIWDQIMASQAHRGLRQGAKYLEERRYDLARREFLRAVAASPNDSTAHLLLGAAYYWTGEVDRSLEEYRRSLELEPDNAQAYMLIGISMAWKGDVKNAHAAFKKASELDSSRADIQMNLGSVEETLGRIPEALARFRAAASMSPKEPLYHFQLGMLYRKLGRDQDASDSLREALKLYPEFEDALLELAAVEERRGARKAAVNGFRKAVALKSRDSVARLRLGRLHLMDGDRGKARTVFADAFHLTPEEEGSGLQLSISYAGERAKDKPAPGGNASADAAGDRSRALAEPSSNNPLDIFARNLERIPLDQSAVMGVDVVFVTKPKLVKASPESQSGLKAALERHIGASELASPTAVRREYRLDASKPGPRAEQIAAVLDDLRAVMSQAPEGADVRFGMNLTFTRLAQASAGRGDAEGSPKVSYQPRQVGNDLGLWVMGTGWMALVEEVLPEPGEGPGHPDQSDWWVAAGLGYAILGEGPRALDAFERALRLDAANEAALLGRGVASVMTGNEAAAESSYEEVLKLNPKNRPAREGLKWLRRPSTKKRGANP